MFVTYTDTQNQPGKLMKTVSEAEVRPSAWMLQSIISLGRISILYIAHSKDLFHGIFKWGDNKVMNYQTKQTEESFRMYWETVESNKQLVVETCRWDKKNKDIGLNNYWGFCKFNYISKKSIFSFKKK